MPLCTWSMQLSQKHSHKPSQKHQRSRIEMRSCRFSHCKVQNGSGCGTCVQFVTDYMIIPCASWAPPCLGACVGAAAGVSAPHHYDLYQMLVNFPLWLWLTLRAWSAFGSSLSSASSTAQRLRHQLAPARGFKVVPISTSTATEICRTTGSGPKPHVSKSHGSYHKR